MKKPKRIRSMIIGSSSIVFGGRISVSQFAVDNTAVIAFRELNKTVPPKALGKNTKVPSGSNICTLVLQDKASVDCLIRALKLVRPVLR